MIRLKTIDYTVQVLLIVGSVIVSLLFRNEGAFFFAYFIVGGWQVLSVLVHFFYPLPIKTTMRKIYLFALLTVLLVALGGAFMKDDDAIIYLLFALLIVSPIMAIYYMATCIKETNKLKALAASTDGPVQPNS